MKVTPIHNGKMHPRKKRAPDHTPDDKQDNKHTPEPDGPLSGPVKALRKLRAQGKSEAEAHAMSGLPELGSDDTPQPRRKARHAQPHEEPHRSAITVRLSEVEPRQVSWLWSGRIPLGKVTVLDGDPGLGKSLLSLDLAARVTTARLMPDGSSSDLHAPAGVLILSAEDDLSDTIRPRLEAAGADLALIVAFGGIQERHSERLPTLLDIEDIRRELRKSDARLMIVDPLMAYLPSLVNSYRDQDVRGALAPLAALVADLNVALLVIRHLNKTLMHNALYRGGGSIGIVGAARSGLLVAQDPDAPDGTRHILVATKANLAKLPPALAYEIDTNAEGIPYISWHGATLHTAATLLAQQEEAEDRSALEEAKDFLRDSLTEAPQAAKEVKREAEQAGIAEHTLRRARAALGIKPLKTGRPGEDKQLWFWSFPSKMPKSAEDAHKKTWASSGENGHLRESE